VHDWGQVTAAGLSAASAYLKEDALFLARDGVDPLAPRQCSFSLLRFEQGVVVVVVFVVAIFVLSVAVAVALAVALIVAAVAPAVLGRTARQLPQASMPPRAGKSGTNTVD
jgi:hypothetical protein